MTDSETTVTKEFAAAMKRRIGFVLGVAGVAGLLFAAAVPSRDVIAVRGRSYVYPLMGTKISSDYGKRVHPIKRVVKHHDGLDLAAPYGAPIRAIAEGTVVFADPWSGYGKLIVIKHEKGMTSHYGHCQELKARPGQHITAGQIIGTVGSTGISTGPHLHFEIRVDGEPQNPERFIPGLAQPGEG